MGDFDDVSMGLDTEPTSLWYLIDRDGRGLTGSLGCGMSVAILTQALVQFPMAVAVVSENFTTYWATEDVLAACQYLAHLENLRTWAGDLDEFLSVQLEEAPL